MSSAATIHGTGLVLDGLGILIRGASGSGKSLLALDLLEHTRLAGTPGALVSDDRIALERMSDGLVMVAPDTLAGMIELRGRGIIAICHMPRAPLHLVVDLVDTLERMPEDGQFRVRIEGLDLARCPVPRRGIVDGGHQRLLVGAALAAVAGDIGSHPTEMS
ncbi:HPr kinase/phosphorylase [Pelagibacterium montanilacus]|uniref:HPr kinase/phosphorylase n=1 Tax=Pelagibacterium montanilacus TaxID=2185280 RepID=UPI000F8CB1F8|nr:hypothetical protein [Pelagibacterium montanilacus]